MFRLPWSHLYFDVMLDHQCRGVCGCGWILWACMPTASQKSLKGYGRRSSSSSENLTKWQRLPSVGDLHLHHFEQIVSWMLGKGRHDPDATATALALARTLVDSGEIGGDRLIEPVLSKLLSDFPEVTWQLIGQAIVSDDQEGCALGLRVGGSVLL